MTLKVTVEGIYQSDIGSRQKQNYNFELTFELSGVHKNFIDTHILRRFIPMSIKEDKKKQPFSRIATYTIVEIEEIDKNCNIEGKNIFEMSEYELQDLARFYNLYEIPLPKTTTLRMMREKAALAYLKYVLKIPMEKPEDKEKLDFFKKESDGSYKTNFKVDSTLKVKIDELIINTQVVKEQPKISLESFNPEASAYAQSEENEKGLVNSIIDRVKSTFSSNSGNGNTILPTASQLES